MRVTLLIVLSTCLSLHAQVFQSPASFISLSSTTIKPPPTPTTLSGGEVPLIWAQGPLGTNSSVVGETNLASSGSAYNPTNKESTLTKWPIGGGTVNGHPTASFRDANAYLRNDLFTNTLASGWTLGMVVAVTNTGSTFIIGNTNATRLLRIISGNFRFDDGAGHVLCSLNGITNQWLSLIMTLPPNGANNFSANITLYTNGVSSGTVTASIFSTLSGLSVGDAASGQCTRMELADFEIYTNLSAGSITDLHTYHKNTFGVP